MMHPSHNCVCVCVCPYADMNMHTTLIQVHTCMSIIHAHFTYYFSSMRNAAIYIYMYICLYS